MEICEVKGACVYCRTQVLFLSKFLKEVLTGQNLQTRLHVQLSYKDNEQRL